MGRCERAGAGKSPTTEGEGEARASGVPARLVRLSMPSASPMRRRLGSCRHCINVTALATAHQRPCWL